jgi:replicative DNA helicase
MTRAEIENQVLALLCQEPLRMAAYSSQLTSDMFTQGRDFIADALLRIPPQSVAIETLQASLRGIDTSFYSGQASLVALFSPAVVFRDAVVQLLLRDLFELKAKDICMQVGYQLTYAANNGSNIYVDADAARMNLVLPQLGDRVRDTDSIFDDMLSPDRQSVGLKSRIAPLDNFIGFFEPGDMVIIAGNAGMCKTSVALHIMIQNVLHDEPMGFYSLEMPDTQLVQRWCCSLLSIPNDAIKQGSLTLQQKADIDALRSRLANHRWFVNAKARTLLDICNGIRAKAALGYKAFVVDYLQLVTVVGVKSREQEIATIARQLKDVAMETHTIVFALSQLSRENTKRANTKPKLSDLRESGEIEQAADYVLFPYRPAYFGAESLSNSDIQELEVIIGKGRSTGAGSVDCFWNGKYTQILSYV